MPLRKIRGPLESPVPMALEIRKKYLVKFPTASKDDVQTGIFDSPVIVLQANW